MRVTKEADERKNEILDVAETLFELKGFDGTSTNDILEKVGIARGTLYYHFKSKEDIMDGIIERYNNRVLAVAKRIATDKSIPVLGRIIQVILSLQVKGEKNKEMMAQIHKPQNALMHQKIQRVIITEVTPILAELIREGIDEKIFNTPYPYECMEMIIAYANTVFDENMVMLTEEEMMGRVQAFIYNLERLLGVLEGSLSDFMEIFNQNTGGQDE